MWFVEFLKAQYRVLYFSIFSLMAFLLSLKSHTFVILQMITLCIHMTITFPYLRNLLYLFKINSLKENPGKFQFMILGKKNCLKYSLKIGFITIKESNEVELLGITIDKNHIEKLCCTAQYKLHALRWIRQYLTLDKAKLLGNAFNDNLSNYAPLIRMFWRKTTYSKIQKKSS